MSRTLRRLVAAGVVAGSLAAFAPAAEAQYCRYVIIGGRAVLVCLPIEP